MKKRINYYPFGMPMPNRTTVGDYRYAFQGQEKDAETGMEAFETRLWDSRIGRWLTTDPAGQFHSPYLGMGNNPINGVDNNGAIWDPLIISFFGVSIDLTALKIDMLNKYIDSKLSTLKGTSIAGLTADQANDLHLRISYLSESKKRIEKLGKDATMKYKLADFASGAVQQTTPTGLNEVSVPYNVTTSSYIALTIHEINHAYQTLNGVYKIKPLGTGFTFASTLGNYQPETESYRFQYSYDPNSLPDDQGFHLYYISPNAIIKYKQKINFLSEINNNYVSRILDRVGNLIYFVSGAKGINNNNNNNNVSRSPRYW